MNDQDRAQLRGLTRKWIAQANHPQYTGHTEYKDALLKCAKDLQAILHAERNGH
jgi:hypothetical protein